VRVQYHEEYSHELFFPAKPFPKKWAKDPKNVMQKNENLNNVLGFIQSEGLKLVNIGSGDIAGGNIRIILGLIWTLILRYQIQSGWA
jgi:filamin